MPRTIETYMTDFFDVYEKQGGGALGICVHGCV